MISSAVGEFKRGFSAGFYEQPLLKADEKNSYVWDSFVQGTAHKVAWKVLTAEHGAEIGDNDFLSVIGDLHPKVSLIGDSHRTFVKAALQCRAMFILCGKETTGKIIQGICDEPFA